MFLFDQINESESDNELMDWCVWGVEHFLLVRSYAAT